MQDYLYSSGRIRVLENALIGRERLETLLSCKSVPELWEQLREYGVEPLTDASGKPLREETLLSRLQKAYATVEEMLPGDRCLRLWRYRYDCNNVKAAIKAFARGIDPCSMMFDFGACPTDAVIRMAETGVFVGLPSAMQAAAAESAAAYAKTHDPQVIDLLLDRACFADMLAEADASGVSFATALVRMQIDLTNLLIALRILRMRSGEAGKLLFSGALLGGGFLSQKQLEEWFLSGEEALLRGLASTRYDSFAAAVQASNGSLTAMERSADNCRMKKLTEAKMMSFGPEVAIAYLLAHETEVQNLRVIFAGKETGLDTETIRERIRDSYV